jgi:hypothetical protein
MAILFPHADLTIVYKYKREDRYADHVGPKLFGPGPELMQSKQASKC